MLYSKVPLNPSLSALSVKVKTDLFRTEKLIFRFFERTLFAKLKKTLTHYCQLKQRCAKAAGQSPVFNEREFHKMDKARNFFKIKFRPNWEIPQELSVASKVLLSKFVIRV